MNSLKIESKIIIFGPPPPKSYKLAHEKDKTQLANNYTTTSVLLCWLCWLFEFLWIRYDYFCWKEKKNAQSKKEER